MSDSATVTSPTPQPTPTPDNNDVNANANDNEQQAEQINDASSAMDAFNDYMKDLNDLKEAIKEFQRKGKEIKRMMDKEIRSLKKNARRKRTRKPDSNFGGFRKPVMISDELSDFLGFEKGKTVVRTEVSKKMNEYIRDNKLQSDTDRRVIVPNNKLKKLLSSDYKEGCRLDFFTMQKYIKHHYIKEADK